MELGRLLADPQHERSDGGLRIYYLSDGYLPFLYI